MKLKRSIIIAFAVFIFTLLFSGIHYFSNKTEIRSFKIANRHHEMVQTYYFKDDMVLKQVAVSKEWYGVSLGVANKQQAMKRYIPISQKFNAIKGVTDVMEFKDSYLLHTRTLDLQVIGVKEQRELQAANGVKISGDINTKITMSESEKLLLSSGYTEVKLPAGKAFGARS